MKRDIHVELIERIISSGGSRRGLVIGINQYRDKRLNLRFAREDAEAMHRLMLDPSCGMFPKENVRLLLDQDATRENVWLALTELQRAAGPNDTVWVYFAGHAAPEGDDTYWVLYNTDVDNMFGTGLAQVELTRVMGPLKARRVATFFDCCYSAATAAQKNPSRAIVPAEELFGVHRGEGRITIASSTGAQRSVELSEKGHGAFTYFLLEGLKGKADRDEDGVITLDELWPYLQGKVAEAAKRAGSPQTPMLLGELTHDFALTLNSAAIEEVAELVSFIEGLIGRDDNEHLTTKQAEWCIELIRSGATTNDEKRILREIENVRNGVTTIATFKVLVDLTSKHENAASVKPPPYDKEKEKSTDKKRPGNSHLLGKFIVLGVAFLVVLFAAGVALNEFKTSEENAAKAYQEKQTQEAERRAKAAAAAVKKAQDDATQKLLIEPQAGESRTFSGVEMVWCPPGSFQMGSSLSASETAKRYGGEADWYKDTQPVHTATFKKGFWMGAYEVTNAEFGAFVDATGYKTDAENNGSGYGFNKATGKTEDIQGLTWRNPSCWTPSPKEPVVLVSWNDAQAYIRWLNQKSEGDHFRLPSESEWEYACRAGSLTEFFWGDDADGGKGYLNAAGLEGDPNGGAWPHPFNFNDGYVTVSPVGVFKPNAWNMYDMHGNVYEWCQDWYHDSYAGAPADGSAWESPEGHFRVIRGGAWCIRPGYCHDAFRGSDFPDTPRDYVGFRLLRTP